MNKIPKEILESVEPENREAFKKIYSRTMYLGSTGFIFQWSLVCYCFLLVILLTAFTFFPTMAPFFNIEPISASLVLAFLALFPINYFSRSIRSKLNQKGIILIHALNILVALLVIFFGISFHFKLL